MINKGFFDIAENVRIPFEHHCFNENAPTIVGFPGTMFRLDTWGFIKNNNNIRESYNLLFFEHHGQINASKFISKDEQYSIFENSDHLCKLLKYLKIGGDLHLFGISSGCAILLEFLVQNYERVSSVYMCSPYIYIGPIKTSKVNASATIGEMIAEEFPELYLDTYFYDLFSIKYNEKAVLIKRALIAQILNEDRRFSLSTAKMSKSLLNYMSSVLDKTAIVKEYNIPKKILAGTDDYLVPYRYTKKLASMIDADLCELPDSGHAIFLESPSKLVSNYESFICSL